MEHAEILKPVAVLAGWTMLMWIWMYATRIPAINKLPKDATPGADVGWTGSKLEGLLPGNIQWKAHNYNHLHEAPTVFYAVALLLAMIGHQAMYLGRQHRRMRAARNDFQAEDAAPAQSTWNAFGWTFLVFGVALYLAFRGILK